jgi:hypothetical protein
LSKFVNKWRNKMQGQMPMAGIANLRMRARQGDPQAIQELQMIQAEMGAQGGGMPPQGQPMPPQGGMSQSQFGGGGQPIPADIQARRAQQLIQMLRARGDVGAGQMGQPMRQGY